LSRGAGRGRRVCAAAWRAEGVEGIVALTLKWLSSCVGWVFEVRGANSDLCLCWNSPLRLLYGLPFPGTNQSDASGKRRSSVYCGRNPEPPLGVSKYPRSQGRNTCKFCNHQRASSPRLLCTQSSASTFRGRGTGCFLS